MKNKIWHHSTITRKCRNQQNNHKSVLLWFTGFSGSGKSTLANSVEKRLHQSGCKTIILDGDNIRHGLCSDLDFSYEGREENIRRIGEVSKLFIESGSIVLTAFISPFERDREKVKALFSSGDFIEIFVKCPISVCEGRDIKGMYKRARSSQIKNFTGISSPYEIPKNPDIIVNTNRETLAESTDKILNFLVDQEIITLKKHKLLFN